MFELTISTSKAKSSDINYIINKIRKPIKNMHGILVMEEYEGRSNLAIAVDKSKKDYVLGLIFDAISEAIIRSYKYDFLNENISLQVTSLVTRCAFIRALTMFDKQSDKDFIKKRLKPSGKICIDSLYHFRLWELEKKWKDIASLVSQNSNYLLAQGAFFDLMKFLILTNEVETGEIHIKTQNNQIFACLKEGKEVFAFDYKDNDDSLVKILSELICLAPEKIVLYPDLDGSELSKYIFSLFDDRVLVVK